MRGVEYQLHDPGQGEVGDTSLWLLSLVPGHVHNCKVQNFRMPTLFPSATTTSVAMSPHSAGYPSRREEPSQGCQSAPYNGCPHDFSCGPLLSFPGSCHFVAHSFSPK
eukprot:GHVL01009660.1.p1 GENE.GHVL01009660.1~~GHVL01009660.1.p1  ORF type:complete len:108 (+),score=2.28 GHVL01009660.1:889-1212(+)